MSGKFTSSSSLYRTNLQEEFIRQIVQDQLVVLLQDIKEEIEHKIKSIDRSIELIRKEMRSIDQQQNKKDQLAIKINKIQEEIRLLKHQTNTDIKSSRTKSFQKDRKPIFNKNPPRDNLSFLLSSVQQQINHAQKSGQKGTFKLVPLNSLTDCKSSYLQEQPLVRQQSIVTRTPLEESTPLRRWLPGKKSSSLSCLHAIINEQDLEQSHFY